jgi:uncharacterized protein (TIGR03083 family)
VELSGRDDELRELLAAYALDAVDEDEAVEVEAFVARDADAAREADSLREAAAWVGASEALAPPESLRRGLFDRARRRDEVRAFVSEVDAFDALVVGLPEELPTAPTWNGLSVPDLVAHLAAMETAVTERLGAPGPPGAPTDVEARTAEFVAEFRGRPLADARRTWRAAADALATWAREGGETTALPWWGVEVPRRDLLAARAFELWTHGNDIRRVLGRPPAVPDRETLRMMSDVGVNALPTALELSRRPHPGARARVVLTGPGGGEWTLGLGGDTGPGGPVGAPDVTITADVIDFCLVVGERMAPEELVCAVEGDRALASDLLAAASAFATL